MLMQFSSSFNNALNYHFAVATLKVPVCQIIELYLLDLMEVSASVQRLVYNRLKIRFAMFMLP